MINEKFMLLVFGIIFTLAIIAIAMPRPRVDQINLGREACEQAEKDNVILVGCYKNQNYKDN